MDRAAGKPAGRGGLRIARKRVEGLRPAGSDGYTPGKNPPMVKARASRRPVDAPHVERAYRNLKAAIVEGRYRPGASLSEVSLASEHGMSRTPIREGLARLWQEGYLDRVVGHGYFVGRVTVQQIHDTFDVRRLLEGAAAARAAELATAEDANRLRSLALVPIGANLDYRQSETA